MSGNARAERPARFLISHREVISQDRLQRDGSMHVWFHLMSERKDERITCERITSNIPSMNTLNTLEEFDVVGL